MHRRLAWLAIPVVAVLLAGCATPPASSGSLPATPAVTDRLQPTPMPHGITGSPTPALILSAPADGDLESTPWTLTSAEGGTLSIHYVAGGGCSEWRGVRIAETSRSVEIWTTVHTDRGQQACAAYLAVGAATVRLDRPLGSRVLLHAPVSPDWKVYEKEGF